MIRLIAILALAAIVVLAALTAFGSIGGWVASLVLVAVVPMGLLRRSSPAGAVMIVVLVVLGASLIPAARYLVGGFHRWQSSYNLFCLHLALHSYHNVHGSFPPAVVTDDDGHPMHSWRVLVLPYMEQEELFRKYDFNEPWNGPNNRRLASAMPRMFRFPALGSRPGTGTTGYTAVVGPETGWLGSGGRSYDDFASTWRTLFLVETFGSDIHWMEPRDLSIDEFVSELHSEPTFVRWWLRLPPTGWRHYRYPPGRAVVMVDGSVLFVPDNLSPETVRSLGIDNQRFLRAFEERERLPAVLADFPVAEDTIRCAGFLVFFATSIALLIVVRGRERTPTNA
jgi:hypothetical protein